MVELGCEVEQSQIAPVQQREVMVVIEIVMMTLIQIGCPGFHCNPHMGDQMIARRGNDKLDIRKAFPHTLPSIQIS